MTTSHQCICGYEATSEPDLDEHILASISGSDDVRSEPAHCEARNTKRGETA